MMKRFVGKSSRWLSITFILLSAILSVSLLTVWPRQTTAALTLDPPQTTIAEPAANNTLAFIPNKQGQIITYTWDFESGSEGWLPVDHGNPYAPSGADTMPYWESSPDHGPGVGVWRAPSFYVNPSSSTSDSYSYIYIRYPHIISFDQISIDYYVHNSGLGGGWIVLQVFTSTNQSDWYLAGSTGTVSGSGYRSRTLDVDIDDYYVMVLLRVKRWLGWGAYGYLDNLTLHNCEGCNPVLLEVLDTENRPVTNLNLNDEGWPSPNPLTVQVTLNCPAGGPDCPNPFDLNVGPHDDARFYLYDKDLMNEDGIEVDCFWENFIGGASPSHRGYETSCARVGALDTLTLQAGEKKVMRWYVWVQPSNAVDLDFSAHWGDFSDSQIIQVPLAQIHPIGLLQGFFGNSEGFVSLLFGPLITTLERMGYQYDHTLFLGQYSYWADITYASGQLSNQLVSWQATARQVDWVNKYPDEQEGFFDLMGLSQGALVVRTYAQTGAYPVDLHRLLLVGSPNRGAPYVYRAREGLEADAGLWQLMLDQGLKAVAAKCGKAELTMAGQVYFTARNRYEALHDPICGMLFFPQILPAPGPNDVTYLYDDSGGYPHSRQSNPLLEGPPSDIADDPWWRPQGGTPYPTSYLNLNSSENMSILGNRIGGFGNLYLLYNDGIDEAQGYRVDDPYSDIPLWRNGKVTDPRSFTGPSDGSVPFYSARAADLWPGSEGKNLFVGGDNRNEVHANLPVYPESQQVIAEILTGFTSPFTTPLNAMNNYVQTGEMKAFSVTGMSPIELFIIDPAGRRLGHDPVTGQFINEIPLGFYNHPVNETADLMIFDPLPGEYNVTIIGTGVGDYTILAQFADSVASAPVFYENGTTQPGLTRTISLTVPTQSSEVDYPPDVFAGPDTQGWVDEPVSFTGTVNDINPGDTFEIMWDFGDGATSAGTLVPIHAFTDKGSYIVTLTVTDTAEFVVSDTLQVAITERPIYLPIILKQASGSTMMTIPAVENYSSFSSPIPAPTPTPSTITIDLLIASLHKSYQQGQIDNDGIYQSLDNKLSQVQEYAKERRMDKAVQQLQVFINQVEAQNGKHISIGTADQLINMAQQLIVYWQE